MTQANTKLLTPSQSDLEQAADILRAGGLVAFPTETVYGLGADAGHDTAVAEIFAAKGRPAFNPLIAHLPDASMAAQIAVMTPMADRLASAFWPGALTLVLRLRDAARVSKLVTAGQDSIALRVPDHPVAQGLLQAFGGPVAAPSANPSGRISPTTAAHVLDGLGGQIAAVVDGGACGVGVESTIIDARGDAPVLLRAGGIPAEAITDCLGQPPITGTTTGAPIAPGQLSSHYAPQGRVRLNVTAPKTGEVMLGFGPIPGDLTLSASGDLMEAAANLFARLHDLDAMGATHIAVAPVPDHGLGRAINDRLRRAAVPR